MVEFYECKRSGCDHLYLGEMLSGEERGHLNLLPGRCGVRGKIVCPFRKKSSSYRQRGALTYRHIKNTNHMFGKDCEYSF